jgi:lipopolysaccharide transport system permease protein
MPAPPHGWLSELWHYKELLWFLAWRDVKVRYKQTVLGAGWAILQPLLSMIVISTFFGRLNGIANREVPYPIFAYCALVPWSYFSTTVNQAGNSLVTNANLIKKVYFPRVLLPASTALSGLIDFAVGSAFLLVLMPLYGIRPTWLLSLYPILMLAMWMFTLSVSMWLAALNVRYRDVKYTLPFLTQLGLLVTPVIYPQQLLPPRLQMVLALNPLTGLIEGFRACVFPGHEVAPGSIAISLAAGVVLFVASGVYFRNAEKAFADIV